jgi:hypothetical protein
MFAGATMRIAAASKRTMRRNLARILLVAPLLVSGCGAMTPTATNEGLSPATWILDPEASVPTADATTFTVLVTETACASGQPMGGRLLPPSITYGEDAVLVVFSALPPGGDLQTCPSNPSMRAVVTLREPLGDRRLLDAGLVPPAEPVAPSF